MIPTVELGRRIVNGLKGWGYPACLIFQPAVQAFGSVMSYVEGTQPENFEIGTARVYVCLQPAKALAAQDAGADPLNENCEEVMALAKRLGYDKNSNKFTGIDWTDVCDVYEMAHPTAPGTPVGLRPGPAVVLNIPAVAQAVNAALAKLFV